MAAARLFGRRGAHGAATCMLLLRIPLSGLYGEKSDPKRDLEQLADAPQCTAQTPWFCRPELTARDLEQPAAPPQPAAQTVQHRATGANVGGAASMRSLNVYYTTNHQSVAANFEESIQLAASLMVMDGEHLTINLTSCLLSPLCASCPASPTLIALLTLLF